MNRASIAESTEIGSGGNGIVCEAWIASGTEPLALKRLRDDDRHNLELVQRFKREIRILQGMDHPNIIKVIASDIESDDPWFLMPRAQFSVEEWMKRKDMEDARIRVVLRSVTNALIYSHSMNIIHRDIKPSNILVMPGNILVVTDFGLGFQSDSSSLRLTRDNSGRGTQGYAAPEQWVDATRADQRSDVYSVGSLLLHLCTKEEPAIAQIMDAPFEYRRIIRKCREVDPSRRYQTMLSLREDLDLLWSDDEELLSPLELASSLLSSGNVSGEDARRVLELYNRNSRDKSLFTQTLSLWNREIIGSLIDDDAGSLQDLVDLVCDNLPSTFPFGHLDKVANVLEISFNLTEDDSVRQSILVNLMCIGSKANRWSMGRAFARLVSAMSERHEHMMVRDVLAENPFDALWIETYIDAVNVHPIIRQGIELAKVRSQSSTPF